ncbi:spore coat protein U domain-containing protein [Arsenophonus endosymbiont of Aleurodicus floccissimus]|uniref:spore coat protein U domain-containing protein n=1 Tax=Arsenophonus endosymbiont of Aleurodicus floccissimus TaxID=2152761 RepID=UPI000E6B01AA|nr:spore coat protein U domain-containing protein [Arsenophonus endosymbiont of Aleurodicus floccissimus]
MAILMLITPNTSLTLACTPGTVLSMSIDGGSNYTTSRDVMQSGFTTQLPYQLYADSAHTIPILVNQNVAVSYTNSTNIIACCNLTAPIIHLEPILTY